MPTQPNTSARESESGKVSVKVTCKMRPGGGGDVSQGEESVRYGKWGEQFT